MRFWLLHSGDVPLQDQIAAQVSLGILSGELAPGERLPSVRELARRFHIHSNTVSLAYRRLERELWLEARRGSGMYVRAHAPAASAKTSAELSLSNPPDRLLDSLLTSLVQNARRLHVSDAELVGKLEHALARRKPTALLMFEPDASLRRILLAELVSALPVPVTTAAFPDDAARSLPDGTLAMALPSKAAAVRAALPPGRRLHTLKVRSVPQSLAPWLPAPAASLVGVASSWPPFLDFARTMLIAAGFEADSLLIRNPADPEWLHGLEQTAAVVCDAQTATLLPAVIRCIPFRILADEALEELKALL